VLAKPQCSKIKEIKDHVRAMLEERHALTDLHSTPSQYWADFCKYFDYMMILPDEAYDKLRVHTYHLTGDNYQTYYFGAPQYNLSSEYIQRLASQVPSEYLLEEPKDGIGFVYPDGRFISMDIARYQEAVNSLYRAGILPSLKTSSQTVRNFVLEIGGGYGGLAHHLSRILNPATYVIVDLPETLLFSASYLTLQNPGKKIYLYGKANAEEFLQSKDVEEYDFVLIPNYRLDLLEHFRFPLTINMASFQEMRPEQVATYLDFICRTCTGVLYSFNQVRNALNHELKDLITMLRARFTLRALHEVETKKTWRSRLKGVRSFLDRVRKKQFTWYQEYLCEPIAGLKIFSAASKTKFSVVIPTYNRVDRLENALKSVFAQTFSNYEVIVVDDGSTDGTQKFLEKYPSVRAIYQINQGPAAARNTGIRAASGEFVVFLDSDDWWAPDKLERQARYLDSHPDVALVHGYFESVDDRGVPLPKPEFRKTWWDAFRSRGDRYENWLHAEGCGIQTSAVAIRRSCFDQAGLFDPSLRICEDYDLFLRVALHGKVGSFNGGPVSYFRYHGSIPIEKVNEAQIRVLKKHQALLESKLFSGIKQKKALIFIKQSLAKLSFLNQNPREGRKYFHQAIVRNPAFLFSWPTIRYYAGSFLPQALRKQLSRARKHHAKV